MTAMKQPAKSKKAPAKAAKATSLVLRTCDANMRSYNGFQWPKTGEISAPDWRQDNNCGKGLHGWLHGAGDYSCSSYLNTDANAKWLVVRVITAELVMLGGKCKFPRGEVVFCGDKADATAYLIRNEPNVVNFAVIGASLTVGDEAATLVAAFGTATAGYRGTATAGYRGTATAGDGGTATAGYGGTATAGYDGTATAGDDGTATAGYRGTATAGDGGTATAGDDGELRIRFYDSPAKRYRTVIAYVGENGIEANVPYLLDEKHAFVKKT